MEVTSESNVMSFTELEEFESLARARRCVIKTNGRTRAIYGGLPPDLKGETVHLPGYRSFALSEPNSILDTDAEPRIQSNSKRLRIGFADTVGRRSSMEDEIVIIGQLRHPDEDFIAIFDGHSGRDSSTFAANHLYKFLIQSLNDGKDYSTSLHESFVKTNEKIKEENISGGTTALVALFVKDSVYIANAGDSRAVLSENDVAIRCTTDHKPELPEEESRILKSGGIVTKITNKNGKTIGRVNGMLAVSRALGDLILSPYVSCEPEIKKFSLSQNQHKMLIFACDGLWDVVGDQEAVTLCATEEDPAQAAVKLRDVAYQKGSGDNISVVVVYLPTVPRTEEKGRRLVWSLVAAIIVAFFVHLMVVLSNKTNDLWWP